FKAAYNNLSLMQYYNGQIADAIANAERALSIKPDDFHAHSNLTRYLLAEGRAEEARLYVERMKAIESGVFDKWLKQAEACATIGDDRGILDAFGGAEATGLIEKAPNGYLLCHVTAVANWRLGNEDKARTLWKKCLDLAPAFDTARENLADSRKPAGQRNGPWSFLLNHWISKQATDDLSAEAKRASKRGEKQMAPAVGRFLQKRPEVLNLLPILFERGDPSGREVAINLATWARKPETIQMLADFALSRNGPDELRMKAAHEAQAQGAPLSGTIRFWLKGEWQELRLRKTAITHEPRGEFPPEVVRLMQEAHRAMYEQDGVKGEQLLKQALELAPDTPSLLNNLALAYILQGRKEESDELVTQIFERFPDYLFAHTHMAHRRMQEGKYDEAEEMLIPLMEREVLHTTEAAAIYNALIELYLRRGNMEFAQRYFDLLEKVDPDNMNLDQWRSRLKKTRDLERFRFGLRRR
ncbi:MAG: tetratricopeptide repeat protein, partial [Blastocatellia bacterium]